MQKAESNSLGGKQPLEPKYRVVRDGDVSGNFPYIIYKTPSFIMMMIPIHFKKRDEDPNHSGINLKWDHLDVHSIPILENKPLQDELIILTRKLRLKMSVKQKHEVRLCLVFGENDCVYFEHDSEQRHSKIPVPTVLIGVQGQILSMLDIKE
jgi:hypothetical protein